MSESGRYSARAWPSSETSVPFMNGSFIALSRTARAASAVAGGSGMSQEKLTAPRPPCSTLSTVDGAMMSMPMTPACGSSGLPRASPRSVLAYSVSSWMSRSVAGLKT